MRRKNQGFPSIFPSKINPRFFDYTLFTTIIMLTITGLTFLYSSSSAISSDPAYYFKKQLVWSVFSIILMLFIAFIDLEKIRKYIPFIVIFTIFLLILTLFMPKIHKTRRWIPLGFMNLQTSELAKISFVLYISDYIDRNFTKLKDIKFFLKPLIIIGFILVLIAIEPDLGTPALIFIASLIILFVYGANIIHIIIPFILGIIAIIIELKRHSYRMDRIKILFSPWNDPTGKGFQVIQSLAAIGSGWWLGRGPGNSVMKLHYLPESHTDFIFPIIAEEIGFIGVVAIIFVFVFMFIRAYNISKNSNNSFLSILSYSSIITIIIQAFFNISMAVGLFPTKGLPLPFFSYGGSSIITTMILCGFILNTSLRRKGL
jgi:cell division protein FtsW